MCSHIYIYIYIGNFVCVYMYKHIYIYIYMYANNRGVVVYIFNSRVHVDMSDDVMYLVVFIFC